MTRHLAGKLKQSNKKHKAAGSKRATKKALGGKVSTGGSSSSAAPAPSASKGGSAGAKKEGRGMEAKDSKAKRQLQKLQYRKKKMEEMWLQKRLGTSHGPPKIVAIVPLSHDVNVDAMLRSILREATSSNAGPEGSAMPAVVNAAFMGGKTKLSFLRTEMDILPALDVARVADVVLFAVAARSGIPDIVDVDEGLDILTAIKADGLPECLCCLQGFGPSMGDIPADFKRQAQLACQELIESDVKCIDDNNMSLLVRTISVTPAKPLTWRSHRSYLVGEAVEIEPTAATAGAAATCRVRLSGYLRGAPMNVDSLMHIPGVGTCRVESVECVPNYGRHARHGAEDNQGQNIATLKANPSKQESLVMEGAPNELMGEQTWPSEAEMAMAGGEMGDTSDPAAGRNRRNIPGAIPDGMSTYQADWFVDEEGQWSSGAEEEGEGEGEDGSDDEDASEDEAETNAAGGAAGGKVVDFAHLSRDEEMEYANLGTAGTEEVASNSKKRRDMLASELQFPDEMDTPEDVPARQRFARYRALQSFRASPWHPKENLPLDYARIHQFERFENSQRRAMNEVTQVISMMNSDALCSHNKKKEERKQQQASRSRTHTASNIDGDGDVEMDGGADSGSDGEGSVEMIHGDGGDAGRPGRPSIKVDDATIAVGDVSYARSGVYVRIVLVEVPAAAAAERLREQGYLAAFGLLRHENKLSVLNFMVQRTNTYQEPIRSKDRLIIQLGFRMFATKAIFSEANLHLDKHKMERFLQMGSFNMVSSYGPITYLPCPVLIFKEEGAGGDADDGAEGFTELTRIHKAKLRLVATGTLSSVDPDRIVLKKIILTGHPIRVHRRCAVVKYLFYDPQDVRWFKPAELATKFGLRGHIKEPIGTHGALKAVFSAPIKQNDTVMLVLFKRVYPKFPQEGTVVVV